MEAAFSTEEARKFDAKVDEEILAGVSSLSGDRLCNIYQSERCSTVAELLSLVQTRTGILASEQKLLLDDEMLEDLDARPLQDALDGAMLFLIRSLAFRWGSHESAGARLEGQVYSREARNGSCSIALSESAFHEGRHVVTFKKLTGTLSGACFGVTESGKSLDNPVQTDLKVPSAYYWTGGALILIKDGSLKDQIERNKLHPVCVEGVEVEITLDCEAHSLSVAANGETLGTIQEVPASCDRIFLMLYGNIGESWEIQDYKRS